MASAPPRLSNAPLPRESTPAPTPQETCLIGLKFIWDNGEGVGADTACRISLASGSDLRTQLDAHSRYLQTVPQGHYRAQLLSDIDFESLVADSRNKLQAALGAILNTERAEAAKLEAEQAQRGYIANAFYTQLAIGKGFLYGAWGLVKTVKEYTDLINPFTLFSNSLVAAWKAEATGGKGWVGNFLDTFNAEQHRELVEALGFDPSAISREQLAEVYETANFIFDDGPSREILGRFAVDYAKAQNHEELAEFGGGVAFEIVLAALLIAFTGGLGLAARGALTAAKLKSLTLLGEALKVLGRRLKSRRIQRDGKAEKLELEAKAEAQTVKLVRPEALVVSKLYRPK